MTISEEDLKAAADVLFDSLDTNCNHQLEKEEVRSFVGQLLGKVSPDTPMDETKFEETFASLDKNHDGSVSRDELFQALVDKAKLQGKLS